MTNKKIGFSLLALMVTGIVYAGSYNAPDIKVGDTSPAFRATKGVSYEDSYHIAGVSWYNNERNVASEPEKREPSSVDSPDQPTPWYVNHTNDPEAH